MPRTIRSRQALAFQPPPSPLIGLRVLVVEDEGLIGLMVEKFLERFGCQIVGIAGSAVDALQIIRTAAIDVAVVDVKLENGTAYALADANPAWLWVASCLLVVQWFGDSLDGTLARVRGIERPKYGYYLDHLVDALATAVIGLGLGLSPWMLLAVGLTIVIAYLVLSINTYLETYAFGVFTLGYGRLGPTEARLGLIVVNTLIALGVGLGFELAGLGLTVLDVIGLGIAARMVTGLIGRAARNLRVLAGQEPAGRVSG